MSFSETAPRQEISHDTGREQVEAVKNNTQQELVGLNQEVLWGNIPDVAKQYLEQKCEPEALPRALNYLRNTKAEEFGGIGNIPEAFWPMVLDGCIQYANENSEIAAIDNKIETEKVTGQQLDTTNVVLSEENEGLNEKTTALTKRITGNLTGENKAGQLTELMADVEASAFTTLEKQVALKHLSMIAATLNQMTAMVTDPEEAKAFNTIIANSSLDLSGATNSAVFSDVMAQVNASEDISDPTKAAISQKLGIEWHNMKANTGGDINDIFNKGYGVESYQDENGDIKTRNLPINKQKRIPIGKGQEIGIDETGGRAIWVETAVGKYSASIPEQATDHDMGNIVRTIQMRASLHGMNMADIFYPDAEVFERGGGTIKIRTEDYTITEKLRSIIIGHETIDGNKLFTDSDLAKIPYLMQFHSSKGDYVTADVDPVQMRKDYRAQGIIDKDGLVDWKRFEQLVMDNRAHTYTAPQNFEETVNEAETINGVS
jgi:hypothetical protein